MLSLLEQRCKVARKVISIICYIVAGFFVYMVSFLSFISEPPMTVKFAIMGGFCVPGLISILVGLIISRFQNWKSNTAIVLLSGAGVTVVVVFTIFCLHLSSEFKGLFPDNKLDFFSDYGTGMFCTIIILLTGALLLWKSKKAKHQP
jgi:hypothetical protein